MSSKSYFDSSKAKQSIPVASRSSAAGSFLYIIKYNNP